MLQGLIRFVGYVVVLAASLFVLTGVWIIYDGIHDTNGRVDVALVPGYGELQSDTLSPSLQARLDAVEKLYRDGNVHHIIVSGETLPGQKDESEVMASYLKDKGVPSSVVIEDHRGEKSTGAVQSVAHIMHEQHWYSIVLVDSYYHIVHQKLVLTHEGIKYVGHVHTEDVKKEDVPDIIYEDIAIYKDLNSWYLLQYEKNLGEDEKQLKEKVGKDIEATKKLDLSK